MQISQSQKKKNLSSNDTLGDFDIVSKRTQKSQKQSILNEDKVAKELAEIIFNLWQKQSKLNTTD